MTYYKVVRFFYRSGRALTVFKTNSLTAAQRHCQDPETSSTTCSSAAARRRTRLYGPWFDGYTEVK